MFVEYADLPLPHLPHLLQSGAVVHSCIFDDRQEDKQEAGPQVDVHCFHIRHLDEGHETVTLIQINEMIFSSSFFFFFFYLAYQ